MKKLYINKMVETFKPGWWQVYAIQNEEMKELKTISEEEKSNYFKEISKN